MSPPPQPPLIKIQVQRTKLTFLEGNEWVCNKDKKRQERLFFLLWGIQQYTANILTVFCTAFGSVTFPTVIWLCLLQSKTAINVKLHSSMSLSVIGTAFGGYNHCQITVGNGTQPMTINWL